MDPLDFLEPDELLQFFHRHKTEMSLMENPQTFVRQLRDYNLIPEEKYKKLSRMKSKENIKKTVYEILDWLERERSEHVTLFWKCVFKDVILNQYPTLKMLHKSLLDGSYHFDTNLPEKIEKDDSSEGSRHSDDDETRNGSVKKKQKVRSASMSGDENEQPGPSSRLTPGQRKKSKKIVFSSPLKKGEKGDIWTWPLYKSQLPVTCGHVEGSLKRDRLARGEKCILVNKQWFTPTGFEKFAGKGNSKNWKLSIRCKDTPLAKLIKEGHLKAPSYKRKSEKVKKPQLSFRPTNTVFEKEGSENEDDDQESNERESSAEEEEEEEEEEEGEQSTVRSPEHFKSTFKVTCGTLSGRLDKKRFASGSRGKSIRTETSWLTPEDFVKKALDETDVSWRKDIEYEGKPLSELLQKNVLRLHSLLCSCILCNPGPEDLDNQKNDDECCTCKNEGQEKLVECDHCPKSFHQKCHIPYIDDATLRDEGAWMCTFCVFRTNQEYYYADEQKTEDVLSSQISQHNMQCQYLLLYLCNADEEQIFATNPSLYLENYSRVIKNPMWLESIAEKLQKKRYQTVGEFVSDVQLIFTNSDTYNQNNPEFLEMGKHLKQLFDQEFKKAFNIND